MVRCWLRCFPTRQIYNGWPYGRRPPRASPWSLFVRAAHPKARGEAITSRPLLLNAVGRKTEHAGHTSLIITSLHVAKDAAIAMLTSVQALLNRIKETTAQWAKAERWRAIAKYIIAQIMACKPPNPVTRLPAASG